MSNKALHYRTSCAGIEVVIADQAILDALFKKLGGTVVGVSDKGVEMAFPTRSAAADFKHAAVNQGAIFD